MRLLDKKTVNTVLAGERKGQIDEGVILAKKIDALRQTLSSLQLQHQEFINGMSEELRKQTEVLQFEIDSKRMELCDLEEKRVKLLEPLTNAWNDYKERERELSIVEEEYRQRRAYQTTYQQELDDRVAKILPEEERIADLSKRVQKQADKTVKASLDVQNLLTTASEEARQIKDKLVIKKKDLEKREIAVAVKERDIEIELGKIEKDKKEIIKTKKQLADQRETLERAIARLK